jgi:hypothetical protein
VRPDPQLVCQAGFGLGVAAVVALWWSSGPSADPRLDAARLAGLLAAYLLAVQILLRARLPYVENGVEVGVLARWHRRGGKRLVWLAAGHAALLVWSYARMSHVSLWGHGLSFSTIRTCSWPLWPWRCSPEWRC